VAVAVGVDVGRAVAVQLAGVIVSAVGGVVPVAVAGVLVAWGGVVVRVYWELGSGGAVVGCWPESAFEWAGDGSAEVVDLRWRLLQVLRSGPGYCRGFAFDKPAGALSVPKI
jgi:hypothetical protein